MSFTSITKEILESAYNYQAYKSLVSDLHTEGRTTNEDNSEGMLNYTKMNIQRSSRWDKRGKINDDLTATIKDITKDQIWLVITEGWCGDAAQVLPFINKMAEINDRIDLKLILRDKHPEVMDEFLTDGSRSIPKVVILDKKNLDVLGSWGPRPKEVHKEYIQKIRNESFDNKKAAEDLHLWYARDKGRVAQKEFEKILKNLN